MVFGKHFTLIDAWKRKDGIFEITAMSCKRLYSIFSTCESIEEIREKYDIEAGESKIVPGKDYKDIIALFSFDSDYNTSDIFYHILNVEYDMNLNDKVRYNIVKDVLAYREYCMSQYISFNKAVDVQNVKKFLNEYANAIKVFNLHGDTPKQRKPYLHFIDECWKYIKTIS